MNATELFHKDGKSTGIFYCSQCRIVHREQSKADECCAPRVCETCGATGIERYYTKCEACREAANVAREAERFEKAEKLTEWSGPIYSEGIGYQDGFFESVEDIEDWLANEEGFERPAYVWTCHEVSFCQLDADHIIEDATGDAYEDWDGEVSGKPELEKAIEVFNEANKGLISWEPNFKRALILSKPQPSGEEGVG